MPSINFPPPVRLPPPIIAPPNPIDLPTFDMPKWEPIPIYRDQVPGIGNVNESDNEDETKEETEEETKEPTETKPEQAPVKPPTVELPAFPPIPLQPSPEEIIPETEMVNEVTIPIINIDVPLPKTEIVVIAVTTAGVAAIASVGGTMIANQVFRQLVKVFNPIFKTILKKLMKTRGKILPSWSRERRTQKYQRLKGPTK